MENLIQKVKKHSRDIAFLSIVLGTIAAGILPAKYQYDKARETIKSHMAQNFPYFDDVILEVNYPFNSETGKYSTNIWMNNTNCVLQKVENTEGNYSIDCKVEKEK